MAEILVVEDERIVTMDIADRLERNGYTVREPVSSGRAALESCSRVMPDLVLMDIQIDGPIDGIETARRLKEIANDCPVVFLTAYSDSGSLERAKALNPSGYILKPFQEQNLIITVEMALSRADLEGKLRRQEELLYDTVEGLDTAVATVSSTGVIAVANAALAELVGEEAPSRLKGRVFNEAVRLFDFARGDDGGVRATLETVSGNTIPVGYVEHTVGDESERVVSLSDLRPRVNYEQSLMRAAREAEEIAESRNRFMSSISHELRTPLNSIMGMSDLAMDLSTDTTQQEYLQIVRRSADSLLHIITSILNYTRVQSDADIGHVESVHLSEFIEDILSNLSKISEKTPLSISPEVDPHLPKTVSMNAAAVREILRILYENAVKFSREGLVRVGIRRNNAHSAIEFALEDEGPGIPESERERIFEPFSQGRHDAAREAGGVGMGLSVAQNLAERIGASISLRSVEGEGSTFTLSVPVTVQDSDTINLAFSESRLEEADDGGHGAGASKLLLVEDEAINRLVNARVLERLGHHVRVAANGLECLELLSEQEFDLVFMDVRMPELNGIEATKKIRAGEIPPVRGIPIVALTAYVQDSELQECYESGMNAVITKPFHADALRDVVNHFTTHDGNRRSIGRTVQRALSRSVTERNSDEEELKGLLSQAKACSASGSTPDFLERLNELRRRNFENRNTVELLFRLTLACRRGDNESVTDIAQQLERLADEGTL